LKNHEAVLQASLWMDAAQAEDAILMECIGGMLMIRNFTMLTVSDLEEGLINE
jgi:hypothetical protein